MNTVEQAEHNTLSKVSASLESLFFVPSERKVEEVSSLDELIELSKTKNAGDEIEYGLCETLAYHSLEGYNGAFTIDVRFFGEDGTLYKFSKADNEDIFGRKYLGDTHSQISTDIALGNRDPEYIKNWFRNYKFNEMKDISSKLVSKGVKSKKVDPLLYGVREERWKYTNDYDRKELSFAGHVITAAIVLPILAYLFN